MNALDQEMLAAISLVGERLRMGSSIRVVVLSVKGGHFCADLDKWHFS